MSTQGRWAFPFLQFPEPYGGDIPDGFRAGKPIRTWKGRVVYNRKRHFFGTKDIRRILKNILENDQGKKTDYFDFLKEWGEIELMLLDLLAQQGGFIGGTLYSLVRESILLLISGQISAPADPLKKEIPNG